MIERNKRLLGFARKLRREMTPLEAKLWYQFLRHYPLKFYKQKIIGSYIADFYCDKARLVIEVDGSQHYEPNEKHYDEERTKFFCKYGITVLRFSNADVSTAFHAVCGQIHNTVCQIAGYDPYSQS